MPPSPQTPNILEDRPHGMMRSKEGPFTEGKGPWGLVPFSPIRLPGTMVRHS